MKTQSSLCVVFLVILLATNPILGEQSSNDRAQLLKAVLNYTHAEALASTDPGVSLEHLRLASREAIRCKPGNTIRAEEIAILNTRIATLKQQIERRLRLTDQFFKTARNMYTQHRLESFMSLLEEASPDLYLGQPRFLELRSHAAADSEKAFEDVQIGHSYFNRREFKKARHWYEQGLRINREYPKGTYYLEQARHGAAEESEGFLWGLF